MEVVNGWVVGGAGGWVGVTEVGTGSVFKSSDNVSNPSAKSDIADDMSLMKSVVRALSSKHPIVAQISSSEASISLSFSAIRVSKASDFAIVEFSSR